MGQLGRTKDGAYADLTLIEAIDLVKKMNVVGGPISLTTLAKIVGIDPRGAGLRSRVQDLKAYGLVEENGGLKLSALGREVARGNPTKTWEAFVNIPLYSKIHDRVQGNDLESEAFWQVLYEITKAEDDAITRRMVRLKNNYMEALPFLRTEENMAFDKGASHGELRPPTNPTFVQDSDFFLVDKKRNFILGIDDNLENLKIAQMHLKNVAKLLQDKAKSKKSVEKRPEPIAQSIP